MASPHGHAVRCRVVCISVAFSANTCTVHTAPSIPTIRALETITFGDEQAATMKADMTEADLSSKKLGVSGAIIVAAFLPKCQ